MPIELWAARLERALTERETMAALEFLPAERRERVLRLRQIEKRREPLCAYLILRRALWEQYRWREFPPMALSDRGKPYFPDFPDVHFNLSHTDGAVLAGLSDQPLGVDIEKIRPLSPRAKARLADGETEKEFFRSWVRREARSKRSGAGIGTMLREEPPLSPDETYFPLDVFPGYAAGVAACRGETLGRLRLCGLDELI